MASNKFVEIYEYHSSSDEEVVQDEKVRKS